MALANITLVGRIQPGDAETRFTPAGLPVVSFRMVVNRWNRETRKNDLADWYRVTAFGERWTKISEYLTKGSDVAVVGEFSTREWQDNNGNMRTSLEVTAQSISLIGGGKPAQDRPTQQEPADDDLEDLPF